MPSLDDDENPELADFRRRFWWTLPLSLSVFALAMFGHSWSALSATTRSWLELVLSAPVVLWAGWPFFVRWAQSIANRSPNMWTLIGTGVGAAFGYSVVATVAPDLFPDSFREHGRVGVYFEAAVDHRVVDAAWPVARTQGPLEHVGGAQGAARTRPENRASSSRTTAPTRTFR